MRAFVQLARQRERGFGMEISFDGMTVEQQDVCNQAMGLYSEWLNRWHEAQGDVWEGQPVRVIRENYFEYEDSPRLLFDSADTNWLFTRVLGFTLNPYHDEGGPTHMTVFVDMDRDPGHRVVHMVQEFDTYVQTIYDRTCLAKLEDDPFKATPEEKK